MGDMYRTLRSRTWLSRYRDWPKLQVNCTSFPVQIGHFFSGKLVWHRFGCIGKAMICARFPAPGNPSRPVFGRVAAPEMPQYLRLREAVHRAFMRPEPCGHSNDWVRIRDVRSDHAKFRQFPQGRPEVRHHSFRFAEIRACRWIDRAAAGMTDSSHQIWSFAIRMWIAITCPIHPIAVFGVPE